VKTIFKVSLVVIGVSLAVILGLTSYNIGVRDGVQQGDCVEPDMCVPGDEWLKQELATIGEAEANAELSKMVDACEGELRSMKGANISDLPELTKSSLALAECRGALKECQRQ